MLDFRKPVFRYFIIWQLETFPIDFRLMCYISMDNGKIDFIIIYLKSSFKGSNPEILEKTVGSGDKH